MPRHRSPKSLRELCADAVASNLDDVSCAQLAVAGDSRNELDNPFETLRNVDTCYYIFNGITYF